MDRERAAPHQANNNSKSNNRMWAYEAVADTCGRIPNYFVKPAEFVLANFPAVVDDHVMSI